MGCSFILPSAVKNSKSIIDIKFRKKESQDCFIYCVLYSLYPQPRPNSNHTYRYERFKSTLKLKDVNFPMKLMDIEKISAMNNISINVLTYDDNEYRPLLIVENIKERHINLLFKKKEDSEFDINRLLYSLHNKNHWYHCLKCFSAFTSLKTYTFHKELCQSNKIQKIKLPKPGKNILSYIQKSTLTPYISQCIWISSLVCHQQKVTIKTEVLVIESPPAHWLRLPCHER